MIRPLVRLATILVIALAASGIGPTVMAGSMPYTITDIGSLPGSARWTKAVGFNDNGDVVGASGGSPFLYSNGLMGRLGENADAVNNDRQIAIPTSTYTPLAINSSGETAGAISGTSGFDTATEYRGTITVIPGVIGYAVGINDSGQVVGSMRVSAFSQPDTTHAFLYSNGKLIDLASSSSEYSTAQAINNIGQIVGGRGATAGSEHPFIYSNGTYTDLAFPGFARGINDSGAVIGYKNLGDRVDGFLYQNGVTTDLTMLVQSLGGGTIGLGDLIGINKSGQILFNADIDGQSHAFLLTPQAVPEPTTLALAGCVGVALLIRGRRVARVSISGCHWSYPTSAIGGRS